MATLGLLTARAMEQLEERYGDQEVLLRTAAVVLEVESDDGSDILVCSTEPRSWVQIAFLDEGIRALERCSEEELRESEE